MFQDGINSIVHGCPTKATFIYRDGEPSLLAQACENTHHSNCDITTEDDFPPFPELGLKYIT